MDTEEVDMLIRFVAGSWPTPDLSDDEIKVWMKALLPLDFEGAAETLDLISKSGERFRPTAGQLVAEYRRRASVPKSHVPELEPYAGRAECGHSLNQVACRETVDYWVGVIRKQLAESKGPMVKSFAKAAGQ